jgi:hypothetical protein
VRKDSYFGLALNIAGIAQPVYQDPGFDIDYIYREYFFGFFIARVVVSAPAQA